MATPYPVLGTNSRVDLEHESVRVTVVDNDMQQEIVKVVTVDAVLAICFGTVQKDTTGVATRHRFDLAAWTTPSPRGRSCGMRNR